MTIIYLVRHGQTGFIGKKLCGTLPGIHLNEEGKQQARRTAEYLAAMPIKAVFSSPMERTVETATPLAEKHGLTVVTRGFLKEVHFGDLEGMLKSELLTNEVWQRFVQNPLNVSFPNGECVNDVQTRVAEGIEQLVEQFGSEDQIACVAHSEVLRLLVAYAIGLPLEHSHALAIDPASVTKLEWTKEHRKLLLLNYCPY